jgi:hypothetical protein
VAPPTRLLAHRVISLPRGDRVVFEGRRTECGSKSRPVGRQVLESDYCCRPFGNSITMLCPSRHCRMCLRPLKTCDYSVLAGQPVFLSHPAAAPPLTNPRVVTGSPCRQGREVTRYGEVERLGGFEVDDQFEIGGLHDGAGQPVWRP